MEKVKITLVRSTIDVPKKQKLTIKALGLRRIGHTKIHNATPQIMGMINKVKHLIKVEKVED